MHKIATRIAMGAGRLDDLDVLLETARNMGMMPGLSICGLPDGATYPIETIVKKFRGELEAAIRAQPADRANRVLSVLN
jgi:NADH:ubiquinone oxidoreductase subunit F (NADH-binding)